MQSAVNHHDITVVVGKVFGKSTKVHSGLSRHRGQLERGAKTCTPAL
jgi:hypothetical protein